jgi:hypothetical protein
VVTARTSFGSRLSPRETVAKIAVVVPLVVGCGQPVLSGAAYDAPLVSFAGVLESFPDPAVRAPHVDIVWVDPLSERPDVPAPPDTRSSMIMPNGTFTLDFFAPPPVAVMRTLPVPMATDQSATFAFGEIIVIDDVNGDGTFSIGPGNTIVVPDRYASAAGADVVIYVAHPMPPTQYIPDIGMALSGRVGYHVVSLDCSEPAVPQGQEVVPGTAPIVLVPSQEGSALTYSRQCLRSHVVTSASATAP